MQKLHVKETHLDVISHRHYWHSFLQHILGMETDLGKDVMYTALQPYQQGYEKVSLKCEYDNGMTETCFDSIVSYAEYSRMMDKKS